MLPTATWAPETGRFLAFAFHSMTPVTESYLMELIRSLAGAIYSIVLLAACMLTVWGLPAFLHWKLRGTELSRSLGILLLLLAFLPWMYIGGWARPL